jgi:nucleotide-binding universal stress UspA family protein
MGSIVCATRGGEGSRAAQMIAIERAKASKKRLLFLYIVDPHSLDDDIDESLKSALLSELNWMGETLLRIAQKRADVAYLGSEVRIREGKVRDEIARFVQETDAELLVLGAPRGTTANVFGDDAIERLANGIQQQSGVKVEIARPDYVNKAISE